MASEVKAAIAEAYRVFAGYHFGGSTGAARGVSGLGPLEERLLLLTPVSEIPADVLAAYAECGQAWDDGHIADDFRALLPRQLELIGDGESRLAGFVIAGLACTQYRDRWPAEEVAAVDRFFAALAAQSGGIGFVIPVTPALGEQEPGESE